MKKTNSNKMRSVTLLVLVSIMALAMTACGSKGTYYGIAETPNESYSVEVGSKTITDNEYHEVYDYVKTKDGYMNVSFHGIPARTFRMDKYEGYDCLFDGDNEIPTYCKSEKGAEEIWNKLCAE